MTNNVQRIANESIKSLSYSDRIRMAAILNDKKEMKRALIEAFLFQSKRTANYSKLKKEYEEYFIKAEIEFPEIIKNSNHITDIFTLKM